MAQTIKVPDDAGPYEVSLSMGRFPFDWDLFDYQLGPAGWSKQKLASGSSFMKVRLPQATRADLGGHTLVWSITLINLEEKARTTEITVALAGPSAKPNLLTVSFDAAPERPHLFVTVQVVA